MKRISEYGMTYSRFRDDSLVAQMSREAGRYTLPSDSKLIFNFYEQLYRVTDGKVTPLIGQVLVDSGYDAAYSLVPQEIIQAAPLWEDSFEYADSTLTLKQPTLLDIGAAGKGYLVDIIGEMLTEVAIASYCIDAGGDILVRGMSAAPFRIGLEHPHDDSQVIGVIPLGDGSICASASNRRAWGDLHHIIDPHTAEPVRSIIATWVVASSAMIADGLATALFFTPAAKLKQVFDFEYILVKQDMTFEFSSGLNAEIFTGATP